MRNCSFRRKADVVGPESTSTTTAAMAEPTLTDGAATKDVATVTGGWIFATVPSVAFARDGAEASDCIEGMFAQHGIIAMRAAAAGWAVTQHGSVQAGSNAAAPTKIARARTARRCFEDFTGSSNPAGHSRYFQRAPVCGFTRDPVIAIT